MPINQFFVIVALKQLIPSLFVTKLQANDAIIFYILFPNTAIFLAIILDGRHRSSRHNITGTADSFLIILLKRYIIKIHCSC